MNKPLTPHPVSFRLDPKLYERLKALADRETRSITKQLEVILKKALKNAEEL